MNSRIDRKSLTKHFAVLLGAAVGAIYAPAALAEGSMRNQLIFQGVLDGHERLAAHFHVNRDLGRAWVAVELTPDSPGGSPEVGETQNMPRSVEGLSYDKTTKQVVYESGNVRAVCAEDSTFLWDKSLKETGQCPLRVSSQTQTVDNGFNPRNEIVGQVVLQLPTATASAVSTR